ncbi:hypothetical protein APS67_006485 [Streptomyces sp. AVP053U2]|nr:hypothetical protein APS67_006485 [Streptomyces sp. AVP053U2]
MGVGSDDFAGSTVFPLDSQLLDSVSEFARNSGVAPEVVVEKTGHLLMARYGDQGDGAPGSLRSDLVSWFVM